MDALLTAACLAVELGTPLALAWLWLSRRRRRPRLAVVFGAITPLSALHLGIVLSSLVGPSDAGRWSSGAVWVMTFVPYLLCVAGGAALSLLPRPAHLVPRYLLGAAVPAALSVLLLR